MQYRKEQIYRELRQNTKTEVKNVEYKNETVIFHFLLLKGRETIPMKKKWIMSLLIAVLTATSAMPVFAAPKQMADGNMFDAQYYAENNTDVAAVLGTDENLLYMHYVNAGKLEGRKPFADGEVLPKFDAVYYAANNPDVAAVLGTDETVLYNHYVNSGKMEGRIPCENGTPFMEVAPLEAEQIPVATPAQVPQQQSTANSQTGGSGVTIPTHEETGANLVWVPIFGGTKYHRNAGCSNMDSPIHVTVETAKANGYEACKRCKP